MNISHSSITNTFLNKSFSHPNNSVLMEYLIKKLESRTINLNRTRSALINIFDIQDLIENKREMIKHFIEIEDDIKQGTNAIKAILAQNKDYTDQLELLTRNLQSIEEKSASDLSIISQLNEKNNNLEQENLKLIDSIKEYKNKNIYLTDKILFFENEVKIKEKEIEELLSIKNQIEDKNNKLIEENSLLKMQLENINLKDRENNIKYNNSNRTHSENTSNNYSNSKRENNQTKDDYTDSDKLNSNIKINNNKAEEIKNIKYILSERENNKKLINEKIKNHFSFEKDKGKELKNVESKIENNYDEETERTTTRQTEKIGNINQNFLNSNYPKDTPDSEISKNRAELVTELVLKAVESTENINLLNKKFGNDFMQKLLSEEISEDFLYQIEETLKGNKTNNEKISNYKFKKLHNSFDSNTNKKDSNYNNDITSLTLKGSSSNNYKFEEELDSNNEKNSKFQIENDNVNVITEVNEEYEEPNSTTKNIINTSEYKISPKKNMSNKRSFTAEKKKKSDLNNSYSSSNSTMMKGKRPPHFEQSLRSYTPSSNQLNKRFVNYTNPYGNFFDKDIFKSINPQQTLYHSNSMKDIFSNQKH